MFGVLSQGDQMGRSLGVEYKFSSLTIARLAPLPYYIGGLIFTPKHTKVNCHTQQILTHFFTATTNNRLISAHGVTRRHSIRDSFWRHLGGITCCSSFASGNFTGRNTLSPNNISMRFLRVYEAYALKYPYNMATWLYSVHWRRCTSSPQRLMVISEMWCCSEGRGRVAELSLCIVHCNVYCCIMMLHNSMSSSNRSIGMIVSISLSLAPSFKCLGNLSYGIMYCLKHFLVVSFLCQISRYSSVWWAIPHQTILPFTALTLLFGLRSLQKASQKSPVMCHWVDR